MAPCDQETTRPQLIAKYVESKRNVIAIATIYQEAVANIRSSRLWSWINHLRLLH